MILHIFNIANSTLASMVRSWSGTSSTRKDFQPEQELVLFDREGCYECRIIRELLTGMNLNVTIMPCPKNGRNIRTLERESGNKTLPMLYDANNRSRHIGGVEIAKYLFSEYKKSNYPTDIHSIKNRITSAAASLVRFRAGVVARPSLAVAQPLTLYSFEASPFSRPVRELLCELEIPYRLINLGKQQKADMGPAIARMHLGPYRPVPGSKREAFLAEHGDVQVPFLIDPNTDTSLFESKAILKYLKDTYAS